MKKLLVVIAAIVMVTACKKQASSDLRPEANVQKLPIDKEHENKEVDAMYRAMNQRGKPPKGPHGPKDTIVNPPPVVNDSLRGCLLLDFDGHNVTGLWGIFTVAGSGLNATDQQTVLNRVKQDYSVFPGVVVTTDETVYNSFPQNKRMRCVITINWEWYGRAGGVAYVGSFRWLDETPCFVFSSLLNFNPRYISDATTHEFGHTVYLRHQSTWLLTEGVWVKTDEYNWGNEFEAPYMGGSYYAMVPKWWIGRNSIGVIQDDIETANSTFNQ